jgi:hypothetical protein
LYLLLPGVSNSVELLAGDALFDAWLPMVVFGSVWENSKQVLSTDEIQVCTGTNLKNFQGTNQC